MSPDSRKWGVIVGARIASDSFDDCRCLFYGAKEMVVCSSLGDCVVAFILLLPFESGRDGVCKMEERVIVR